MKKIIIMLALLGGAVFLSSANANADSCPSGQVMGGRMVGGCVPNVQPSKTYAECIKNGRTLGYSAADVERKCKGLYPH